MYKRSNRKAQSVVEYLLLLTLVGVLAFLAMQDGGLMSDIQDKAFDYYHEGANKIKGID